MRTKRVYEKAIFFCAIVCLLSACGKKPIGTASETTSETVTTIEETTSKEKTLEEKIKDLCSGNMVENSGGKMVPNTDYLPLPEFKQIPENSVFRMEWDTEEGSSFEGTAFLAKTDLYEEPLLITAIHYFGEEEAITGRELSEYIKGGQLHDVLKGAFQPDASIKDVVPILDAVGGGEDQSVEKDLAAFLVKDTSNLTSLSLATGTCAPGDIIYLAAELDHTKSATYPDCLYPCVVLSDDGKEIDYILDEAFSIQGASGGPLLNQAGEVVGIHIGSNGSERYGHSVKSIYDQLKKSIFKWEKNGNKKDKKS